MRAKNFKSENRKKIEQKYQAKPRKDKSTELIKGRMFNSEKVLLVFVCEIHSWVSCFSYSFEFTMYYKCFAKVGSHGKKKLLYLIVQLLNN